MCSTSWGVSTEWSRSADGNRVEPEEVEANLARNPSVRQVTALAPHDEQGQRYLLAFVVSVVGSRLSESDLRATAEVSLPDWMVPARFVLRDTLPVTDTGTRHLPQPTRPGRRVLGVLSTPGLVIEHGKRSGREQRADAAHPCAGPSPLHLRTRSGQGLHQRGGPGAGLAVEEGFDDGHSVPGNGIVQLPRLMLWWQRASILPPGPKPGNPSRGGTQPSARVS
ncbi:hypothetical protein [Saccharopolyspora sp. ASAGF58]|uniref:AMP-binding enzyme n=1 Tax=Saccharopolyspora sp. ASAGF58 TaxID=2719023 RepID=UPI0035302CD2